MGYSFARHTKSGSIKNESEFKEVLEHVLSDREKLVYIGCVALQTSHGQHLADFKKRLVRVVGYDRIQLVTISRPSAYGEYEPYRFLETEQEFEEAVRHM